VGRFDEERTATINRLRGLLSEFGIVLPLKAAAVRHHAARHLEALPVIAQRALGDLLAHLTELDGRIDAYDTQLKLAARDDERARRLMNLRGVGSIGASALVATVGAAHEFRNGRQFAAWLGMVPRQYRSGGKQPLGRITKAGDAYLRTLLIMEPAQGQRLDRVRRRVRRPGRDRRRRVECVLRRAVPRAPARKAHAHRGRLWPPETPQLNRHGSQECRGRRPLHPRTTARKRKLPTNHQPTRSHRKSVTHVSRHICYLCRRPLTLNASSF
jgi:transposase